MSDQRREVLLSRSAAGFMLGAATLFALMVGITLGLPAGYYGGRVGGAISTGASSSSSPPAIWCGR